MLSELTGYTTTPHKAKSYHMAIILYNKKNSELAIPSRTSPRFQYTIVVVGELEEMSVNSEITVQRCYIKPAALKFLKYLTGNNSTFNQALYCRQLFV